MPSYFQKKRQEAVKKQKQDAQINGYTCHDFMLGKSDCEHEVWNGTKDGFANAWYLDWFDWASQVSNNRYIFVGRKGTGKSALARHIREEQSREADCLSCRLIRDDDIKLETILQSESSEGALLYEWLILVSLADMILSSPMQGESILEFINLRKFFNDNRGRIEINRQAAASIKKQRNFDIDFKAIKASYSKEESHDASCDFKRYIMALRDTVVKILHTPLYKEHAFILMFDDLDRDFSLANDRHRQNIVELLRVTQRYNNEVFQGLETKILLFVRDDVYRDTVSCANDTAKLLASSTYQMKWYDLTLSSDSDETKTLLRRYINMRIAYNFDRFGITYNMTDPWQTFIDEKSFKKRYNKSAFKFILDLTFYRPRDLMLFFNNIGDFGYKLPISPENVIACAKRYLVLNMQEIGSELAIIYGSKDKDRCIVSLKYMSDRICKSSASGLSYQAVIDIMHHNAFSKKELQRWLDYWLLVPYDDQTSKLFFPYREQNSINSLEESRYKLPRSIFCYFHSESLTKNYN